MGNGEPMNFFLTRQATKLLLCVAGVCWLSVFSQAAVSRADQLKADEYYKKGLVLYGEGKFTEAEKVFRDAISETKSEKESYYKRGVALYQQGKYEEAEREFQKAITMTEQENDQHYKRGLILYNQGNYKEAEEEFHKAISVIKKKTPALPEPEPLSARENQGATEYIINDGDQLLLKVWQNSDLDDEVIVRPDGMVSFPLVGDVAAAGLSIREFKQVLTERLQEFIKYPQVSVSIKNIGGRRVIVLGQVRSPGVYSVTGRKTILEAIGLAGGFTDDAVASSVMLIKGGFAKPVPTRLDLTKALNKADVSDNMVLESEDMIYVPRRFIKDINYFLKIFLDPVSQGFFIRRELHGY
jgi:polysaccharide export outer membrane protein